MIFGFNTDIAAMDTVYHVQTEVREQAPRLESQIFVRGRCIGKRAGVLPESASDEQIQDLARAQHRWIVDTLRAGHPEHVLQPQSCGVPSEPDFGVLGQNGGQSADPARQETPDGLLVELLGSRSQRDEKSILRVRVLSGGNLAARALVGVNWKIDSASGVLEDRLTNDAGVVELRLGATDATVELEVSARLEGREAKRSFVIKPQL